jgi:hypothetical protein
MKGTKKTQEISGEKIWGGRGLTFHLQVRFLALLGPSTQPEACDTNMNLFNTRF